MSSRLSASCFTYMIPDSHNASVILMFNLILQVSKLSLNMFKEINHMSLLRCKPKQCLSPLPSFAPGVQSVHAVSKDGVLFVLPLANALSHLFLLCIFDVDRKSNITYIL